ncbi:putative polygalacturonase [Lupinus albus]|uniref:Putative polygalacturonase n=1 Tax=Lupinus albus TaxID=3870 RepID=A0A6A4QPQ5_LUPAL|nr:putative polygalacturonase [Lupinus albus]
MQGLVVTFFIFSFASFCSCNRLLEDYPMTTIFSVMDYGAVGDGVTDDSEAFGKAWGDACEKSDSIGTIEVPQGKTFMLKPLKFTGPCKSSSINFKVEGNIVAPSSTDAWTNDDDKSKWLEFVSIYGLIFNGGGQINGHGSVWWESCHALSFNKCNNLQLSDTQHVDSPKGHISITASNNVKISNLIITAPEDSKNTDGIDISSSTYVMIDHCSIATGDDCIALGSGASNINITNIACGPGHGIRYIQNTLSLVRFHKIHEIIHRKNIYHFLSLFCCDHVFSIGSLGRDGDYATVENVYVSDCSITGATNGVRIKTWQGGSGYVRNVNFQRITISNTKNPIIINQDYNDIIMNEFKKGAPKEKGSGLEINGVIYEDVKGTSASEVAINLDCNSSQGCHGITMHDINLTSESSSSQVTASCINANGESISVSPEVSCLTKKTPY